MMLLFHTCYLARAYTPAVGSPGPWRNGGASVAARCRRVLQVHHTGRPLSGLLARKTAVPSIATTGHAHPVSLSLDNPSPYQPFASATARSPRGQQPHAAFSTAPVAAHNLTLARLAGIQRRRGQDEGTAPRLRQVSRHKLTAQDAVDYAGDSLFCQFARVVCEIDGLVPRKELHEAWEAAVLIHNSCPHVIKVADLASGNGLLSWALLVLDTEVSGKRSVLCIDKVQPPSFVRIANAMTRKWPTMRHRHRYVVGSIDDPHLKSQPDVLLVCLHGCGTLSDKVLELALSVGAPLALVPCCHTTKDWARWEPGGIRPFRRTPSATLHPKVVHSRRLPSSLAHAVTQEGEADVSPLLEHMARLQDKVALKAKGSVDNWKQYGKAAAVDQARKQTLRAQGYHVRFEYISPDITPRNRVLIALPSPRCAGGHTSAAPTGTCGWQRKALEEEGDKQADGPLWRMWTMARWHGGATVWRNAMRRPEVSSGN